MTNEEALSIINHRFCWEGNKYECSQYFGTDKERHCQKCEYNVIKKALLKQEMIEGYIVQADKSYKRITYVKPIKHAYTDDFTNTVSYKYSCPVCDALGNKHQITAFNLNCPLCNVNLDWRDEE